MPRHLLILCGGVFFVLSGVLLSPLPQPVFEVSYSTTLFDREGSLIGASLAMDEQWRFAPLDSVPFRFQTALLLFEDEYFFQHPGINPFSILRAIRQNYAAGRTVSGASTLSMQTVRLAMGNRKRSYGQKLIEAAASLKLELLYSKEEILLLYTNHAPFGGNIVGLEAASYKYFGRAPHLISWSEAALLAVLPNQPSAIFPGKNQQALLRKRNGLLDKLHDKGFLSSTDLLLAKKEPLPSSVRTLPREAPHLLTTAMSKRLTGRRITSSIKRDLQRRAQEVVSYHSQNLANNQIFNAAALILFVETGEALAYIGNTDNPGSHGQYVDIITAKRSPGSLLKPMLYATALDMGLLMPHQLLPDIPLFYKGFAPKNFDKKYRGAVPASAALSSSLNVPFVNLLRDVGLASFHQKLQNIGFTSLILPPDHYGLSLILGGAETSLWEASGIYASMVRAHQHYLERPLRAGYSQADYHPNTFILSDEPSEKPTLQPDGHFRFDALNYAFSAMQQVERPDNLTGWERFATSREIAWKTGTSYGFRDAWAIGMNQAYVVAVWAGNADGEGRPGLIGTQAAAPILFDLFELLPFARGLVVESGAPTLTCAQSGMILGAHCTDTLTLGLPPYMQSTKECHYHQELLLDQSHTFEVNSSCYSLAQAVKVNRFILPPIQAWYYQNFHPWYTDRPTILVSCETSSTTAPMSWVYPHPNTSVKIPVEQDGQKGRAVFEVLHGDAARTIFWHLDEHYLGSTQQSHQMEVTAEAGSHTLSLVDDQGNQLVRQFLVSK